MYTKTTSCIYICASGSVPIQSKFDLNLLFLHVMAQRQPTNQLVSSRDGPATANEPTSAELLAMLECSLSTSERCYEEANITESS